MDNNNLQAMRKDYESDYLFKLDLAEQPIVQLKKWFDYAVDQGVAEPNAFTLSTVNNKNEPNARIVLVKEIREKGIVFYTNYESSKGIEIEQNPYVAATFFWQPLAKQVRLKGKCVKILPEESDAYYSKRPLGSRIGAIASPQSKEIENREWLMDRLSKIKTEVGDSPSRPDYWGGYLIEVTEVEFWQGQPSRLHDRFSYTLNENKHWVIKQLAP